MRTFTCQCGSTLFFDSTRCVHCGKTTAMCPQCQQVSAMQEQADGTWVCQHSQCGTRWKPCGNRPQFDACNRVFPAEETEQSLCDYCRLNQVIPDLSVAGNLEKWRRLEAAKRRVLYGIQSLGLPIVSAEDASADVPVLRFDFRSDAVEPVSTGHADGLITINLSEADSVQRERTRVEFGEPQRTLVGHFRHELGHYYWDLLVKPHRLKAFRELFGDERNPSYADAQKKYYDQGPSAEWEEGFISAYATMHPWEDFAETFGAYLDMAAIVSTARHFQRTNVQADTTKFDPMLKAYLDMGIVANEMNRDMGLLDLVPEVMTPPVIEKLRFVHQLRSVEPVSTKF